MTATIFGTKSTFYEIHASTKTEITTMVPHMVMPSCKKNARRITEQRSDENTKQKKGYKITPFFITVCSKKMKHSQVH